MEGRIFDEGINEDGDEEEFVLEICLLKLKGMENDIKEAVAETKMMEFED